MYQASETTLREEVGAHTRWPEFDPQIPTGGGREGEESPRSCPLTSHTLARACVHIETHTKQISAQTLELEWKKNEVENCPTLLSVSC